MITPLDETRLHRFAGFPEVGTSGSRPVTTAEVAESFGQALMRALDRVNAAQLQADRAAEAFAVGEQRDVAQLMIATEQARLALELTVQIRNKVLEAYQEIIRLQV